MGVTKWLTQACTIPPTVVGPPYGKSQNHVESHTTLAHRSNEICIRGITRPIRLEPVPPCTSRLQSGHLRIACPARLLGESCC
jgi:hypothetical protein